MNRDVEMALEEVVEQAGVYEYATIDEIYNSVEFAEELLRFVSDVNKHKETLIAAPQSSPQ